MMCAQATVKDRKETFQAHNVALDKIQKSLEDYLETKRASFPRFYFLSNDELLEILSQAKEPQAVQPHLRKCFDNLVALEFGKEDGSVDILAMFSSEKERVSLGKNLKARGNVEDWLTQVENRMKSQLHLALKAGLLDYDTKPRKEWILDHPGQVVATGAQMTWARDTEAALRAENPAEAMEAWFKRYLKVGTLCRGRGRRRAERLRAVGFWILALGEESCVVLEREGWFLLCRSH
jgi:dynein heavy chain